jgi:hypothetical protein
MPIGAIIGAVASVGGALLGSSAAKKAANAQVQSGQMAIDESRRQYDQTRADFAPWREAGGQAIGQLSGMLQPGYDHTTSPGYQFRFNEGQRAVDSSGAARGLSMSGGTLKDMMRFGQGIAADDFNDQFSRVATVANGGQQANTTLGQLGAQNSQFIGNTMMGQGNARASGYAGSAGAWGGALNNLAGIAMMGGFGGGAPNYRNMSSGVDSMINRNPGIF